MNLPTHIPASKASTKLLKDLTLVREKLQGVEDSTSPTVDRINPLRKIDQELSLRLLHFLSAEMNIPLSLPENMPNEDDEDGYKDGGKVKKTGLSKVHQGEFVSTEKTVEMFGSNFLSRLNLSLIHI